MRGGSERKCLEAPRAVMSTCRLHLDYGCIRKLTTNVVVLTWLERYLSVVMFEMCRRQVL